MNVLSAGLPCSILTSPFHLVQKGKWQSYYFDVSQDVWTLNSTVWKSNLDSQPGWDPNTFVKRDVNDHLYSMADLQCSY